MHTSSVSENAGTFNENRPTDRPCRKCGAQQVTYRVWESHDGGYEDEQFTCGACGHSWWVDGIDS